MEINDAYLSLGSNIGDATSNLHQTLSILKKDSIVSLEKTSSFYETSAWGYYSSNKYINCCVHIKTHLDPFELLQYTQEIEKQLGRTVKNKYSDRIIDIDILFYADLLINLEHLKIPHPLWSCRNFVIYPLVEIVDELTIGQKTISVLAKKNEFDQIHFDQKTEIKRIK